MDDLCVEMKLYVSLFYLLFSAIFTISVCGLFNDAVSSSGCVVLIGGFVIETLYYRIICLEGQRETAKSL
jgi:hypothetical protein